MESHNFSFQEPVEIQSVSSEVMSKTFTAKVFSWMFVGLGITALISYLFGSIPNLHDMLYTPTGGVTVLYYITLFAPIVLVLLMGTRVNKMAYSSMIAVFILFSALMGMGLSSLFIRYDLGSIGTIFLISAGMFGVMAVVGYTTHTDLTKFGSLMMMLLVGIVIASMIGIFFPSPSFHYMLSFLCVAVFIGLTAYDVQKIKQIGAQINTDGSTTGKLAIMGALNLYLDFINLFISLLEIFGRRK